MKAGLIMIVVAGVLFGNMAYASEQHDKMRGCNLEAKTAGLKGDERKTFMGKCLKKDYKLKAATVEKLKVCNAKAAAKQLSEEESKKVLKSCLAK